MNKTEIEPPTTPTVEFANLSPMWSEIEGLERIITNSYLQTLKYIGLEGIPCELSIALMDDDQITNLNSQFLSKDKPTNVLSFPAMELDCNTYQNYLKPNIVNYLGDIAFSYETIHREASIQGKNFIDHTIHLLVHGVLHLLGYDHELHEEAEVMEALEIKILQSLNINNPYQS